MVKAVVGEESRLQSTEERVAASGTRAEVGLVIGAFSRHLDRGFVYDLIPTPPNDAGESSCSLNTVAATTNKSKAKPSSSSIAESLSIDHDWVAEHTRQLCRMMVGGMKVMGIYVWAPDTAFKNSTLLLSQTVKGVAGAAPSSENGSDERLLVHICYSPRRWACRTLNVTSSNLRPCDFKMGRMLSSLRAFRCIYEFNLRLPVCTENLSDTKALNNVLQDGISSHAQELKGANALIDGYLVDLTNDELNTSGDLHEIELLFPFMKDGSMEANSRKEVVGVLVFSGTICSYSYLNAKEPVSQAVVDIKEDIITSLKSRLDVISDEAEKELGAASGDVSETVSEVSSVNSVYQNILKPLRKEFLLPFPRRVFIPWLSGSFVCDYLLPSETFEVLRDHFVELLSMEAPSGASVLELEMEFPSVTMRSFWQVAASPKRTSGSAHISSTTSKDKAAKSIATTTSSGHLNAMFAACFVVLVAIFLGSLLYARNTTEI